MKNKKFQFQVSTRAVLLSGLLATSLFMLNACAESETKEATSDTTVIQETPAPTTDTIVIKTDSTGIDTTKTVADPKRPE
jgi:hypothetical protein